MTDPSSSSSSSSQSPIPSTSRHNGTASSSSYRPDAAFSFPAAFQPSIIRSFQKDSYYLSLLQTQLSDVVRSLLGSRFLQSNAERVSLLAAFAYYATTTWEGAQTLGEEYVGSRMVASKLGQGKRFVSHQRRIAFIVGYVVAPFILSRLYARLRRRINVSNNVRSQNLQRKTMRWKAMGSNGTEPQPSRLDRIVSLLSRSLPSLEDLNKADGWISYATTIHLMLFYLGGKYYKLAQRIVGVQYISIHPTPSGQEPPSYEVLGVLLAIQLGVKMAISLNQYLHQRAQNNKTDADSKSAEEAAEDEPTVNVDGRLWSHKSTPARPLDRGHGSGLASADDESATSFSDLKPVGPSVPLAYASSTGTQLAHQDESVDNDTMSTAQLRSASVEAASQSLLKCTLCMDDRRPELGTSAVTECGHVFDWGCIMNWLREKSECPLCRQTVRANRVLPIYNV